MALRILEQPVDRGNSVRDFRAFFGLQQRIVSISPAWLEINSAAYPDFGEEARAATPAFSTARLCRSCVGGNPGSSLYCYRTERVPI